jgi:hypothetical protein
MSREIQISATRQKIEAKKPKNKIMKVGKTSPNVVCMSGMLTSLVAMGSRLSSSLFRIPELLRMLML